MSISSILKFSVVLLLVLGLFLGVTSRTYTPPFKNADGAVIEGSVAEERRILLGGVEQYVLIRGIDRKAPILLFLHGGPGTSAMPFNRVHNNALEKEFIFVNWDQRGTGHSFAAGSDRATITLQQITSDLDDLVDALRAEFNQDQILLVGHSWGSLLGLHYISQHPEKVAAYIGLGQMAQTAASETAVYDWALAQAKDRQDEKALSTLQEIGPPPYANAQEMMQHRGVVNTFGGSWIVPKSDIQYVLGVLKAPEFSWLGIPALANGGAICLDILFSTFTSLDAYDAYPKLETPVYFMEGRHDRVVSPTVAEDYLTFVTAPHKELIWFEQSAHSPQWEQPEKYHSEVRRIAKEAGLLH